MSVNVNQPFHDFLWESFQQLREQLGKVGEMAWKDHVKSAHEAWHRAKDQKKKRAASFVPPTPAEVTAYSIEIGYPLDGVEWCEGYQTKGWKTSGSAKMVDWQAAVRKWKAGGFTTKKRPEMAKAGGGPLEPVGWLTFMRVNYPQWFQFQHGEDPKWANLGNPSRDDVMRLMKEHGQ